MKEITVFCAVACVSHSLPLSLSLSRSRVFLVRCLLPQRWKGSAFGRLLTVTAAQGPAQWIPARATTNPTAAPGPFSSRSLLSPHTRTHTHAHTHTHTRTHTRAHTHTLSLPCTPSAIATAAASTANRLLSAFRSSLLSLSPPPLLARSPLLLSLSLRYAGAQCCRRPLAPAPPRSSALSPSR